MSRTETPGDAFTVLIVCTGNICRSALAERLGRAYLDEKLGSGPSRIRIGSAGTRAVVGSGMHPDSALALKGLGGDPTGFVARRLVDGLIIDADLVLTMTRDHRRDVLTLAPRALARTFTLREAADLVQLVDDDGAEPPGETLIDRARALVKAMATARSRREVGADDDIRDPIGAPLDVHEQVGDVIAQTLLPLLTRLAALRGAEGAR